MSPTTKLWLRRIVGVLFGLSLGWVIAGWMR